MALTQRLSSAAVNAQVDASAGLLDGGYLRVYDGEQPGSADAGVGASVLLAELRFSRPAFGPAVDGLVTALPIADDSSAAATGTAHWFRAAMADGVSVVFDGSVGTGPRTNLQLDRVEIVAGDRVSVDVFTHRARKS